MRSRISNSAYSFLSRVVQPSCVVENLSGKKSSGSCFCSTCFVDVRYGHLSNDTRPDRIRRVSVETQALHTFTVRYRGLVCHRVFARFKYGQFGLSSTKGRQGNPFDSNLCVFLCTVIDTLYEGVDCSNEVLELRYSLLYPM